MMVCRRRWRLLAVVMVAMTPALALGAGVGTPSVSAAVDNLKTKTGKESVQAREDLLSLAPTAPVPHDEYAAQRDKDLRDNLANPSNADARLNTAILFARLDTLALDKALMEALASKDPAVRYWGAKGLAMPGISGKLKLVGATTVIDALKKAARAETSSIVQVQILHALVVYGDVDGVLDSLEGLTGWIQSDIPSRTAIDEINDALNWLQTSALKTANADKKERAAGIIARLLSFTGQQTIAFKAGEGNLPAPFWTSVLTMVNNGVKLLGTIGGAAISPLDTSAPEMMMIGINDLVGADGRQGTLQKTMPKVAVPPKVGASVTSTAPAGTSAAPALTQPH